MEIRKLSMGEVPPYELLLMADPSRELVEEYVAIGDCRVAEIKGKVIGVYVLIKLNAYTSEIINIAVNEEIQGQGIGKKLIRDAIQTAQELGCKTIEIGTGNSSIGQLLLYQKCGFRITDVIEDFFVDNYDEEIFENGLQCRDMVRLSMNL
jgi:ribosomal protein S18 acetylase RimI-like enzyme